LNFGIASGHHLTSAVASDILESGGNAFDATVAAYLAMFITEPAMASAFAGGFANIHFADGKNEIIDFFCQTPLSMSDHNHYEEIEVDFGEASEIFYAGPASMAVSGAMALIYHLVEHHCRLSLRELVQPAQELAKSGVELTAFQAYDLELLEKIFGLREEGRALFFENDQLKKERDMLYMPQYADFLEVISREDNGWFYVGEIAQMVSDYSLGNGGFICYDDFTQYELKFIKPLIYQWENYQICVPSLPSIGGGLQILFIDQLLKGEYTPLSFKHYDRLLNAFDSVSNARKSKDVLRKQLEQIGIQLYPNNKNELKGGGTSHFNIADDQGNVVSLSTSIGEGSGYFVEGTDMQVNNMLGETALLPDGLNSWMLNERLNSMMCPTFVFKDQELILSTGSGGATRIPFSLGQMLTNRIKHKMNLYQAIHTPRMYANTDKIYLERGYDLNNIHHDRKLSQWDEPHLLFGGTHTIDLENRQAIGDARREGAAYISLDH